jgi:hypothetical protein
VFLRRVSYELLETHPKTASLMMVSSLWVSYIVDFQCFMVYVFTMLYLHMCVQHVVLVGFMEIVVISLTLWML